MPIILPDTKVSSILFIDISYLGALIPPALSGSGGIRAGVKMTEAKWAAFFKVQLLNGVIFN